MSNKDLNRAKDVHKYIEEKLGRPVWTHELADKRLWDEIRERVKPDFLALCGAARTGGDEA